MPKVIVMENKMETSITEADGPDNGRRNGIWGYRWLFLFSFTFSYLWSAERRNGQEHRTHHMPVGGIHRDDSKKSLLHGWPTGAKSCRSSKDEGSYYMNCIGRDYICGEYCMDTS